jgi:hypothetical protein
MKTKLPTRDALEQALADMGGDMAPRRADEFTAAEMHAKTGGGFCVDVIQRRLRKLVMDGSYSSRQLGRERLYRKVDTSAKTR